MKEYIVENLPVECNCKTVAKFTGVFWAEKDMGPVLAMSGVMAFEDAPIYGTATVDLCHDGRPFCLELYPVACMARD